MTLTKEQRAADFIHATLHAYLCGKVPGYPDADLFGWHEEATNAIFTLLLRRGGPAEVGVPPTITIGSGIAGIELSIGGVSTTLTYRQALQFAIDLIDTTQQGGVRGERLA